MDLIFPQNILHDLLDFGHRIIRVRLYAGYSQKACAVHTVETELASHFQLHPSAHFLQHRIAHIPAKSPVDVCKSTKFDAQEHNLHLHLPQLLNLFFGKGELQQSSNLIDLSLIG